VVYPGVLAHAVHILPQFVPFPVVGPCSAFFGSVTLVVITFDLLEIQLCSCYGSALAVIKRVLSVCSICNITNAAQVDTCFYEVSSQKNDVLAIMHVYLNVIYSTDVIVHGFPSMYSNSRCAEVQLVWLPGPPQADG
jgi:hypothetical protein